jgi:hypothetical protein
MDLALSNIGGALQQHPCIVLLSVASDMAVGATVGYMKCRQTVREKSAKSRTGQMKTVEQCEDALYRALAQKEDELQRCGGCLMLTMNCYVIGGVV